ncbi:hypothetical protein [Streptomyces griseocarneus]|uniref:hypothetical protein n=1 Tax=Streptomyces griseocarneus TaxID=51201 RepID=UPI00167E0B3C|nr:hypothetical protein [Streptomyces griseocarneus]MBZ6475777.1 hypothetical protein [Streptomyces griseocarneus]GHG50833.1 hypothetical protein GCM10018779_11290 [Streptomyces griseocarneus]
MRREDVPEPEDRGLSTDDLARASGGDTGDEREETEGLSGVPTYPGESTADTGTEDTGATDTGAEGESTTTASAADEEETPQLLGADDEEDFRTRWQEIQNRFVDDPRDAVHSADALVAEVMQTLATTFSRAKEDLESQWNRGEEADTEALRLALRHYRSFFNRLLTA